MLEGINVGSLSSLNLCGDPQGVRFGTAHFHVALRHWVQFAVQWTAMLAPPRPVYDPTAQHQYEGSVGGTRNTATAFAKAAPPPPPRAPSTSWRIPWRPQWPPHTTMAAIHSQSLKPLKMANPKGGSAMTRRCRCPKGTSCA